MKQVKIVPMAAEHLDRLEQLERMCFSRPWSKKMLAEELDNQCAAFLVAVEPETEQPVGYAGLLVVADEGYITNVAVDPACRRQGVGRALMDLARAHAPTPLYFGAKPGAEGFYEKIGCERSLPSFLIPGAGAKDEE